MKALSIKQPWADMIAQGVKTIEVRTWQTKYRGDLLVCVTKQPVCDNAGKAICIVDLLEVREMTDDDGEAAQAHWYYEGSFAWLLGNIRLIDPFPVRGMPGVFDVSVLPHIFP